MYEIVFEKAVALLFSIIKNHPFVDGNKRTGLHAAITFLELNGHDIAATDSKLVKLGLDITSNLFDEKRAVEILRGF